MLIHYCRRVKVQFDVLEQEARTQREKFDAIVVGVKPVLDCVDLEAAPQLDGRLPHSDTVIKRCKAAWENFKSFNRNTIVTAITHALAVVWSHYLVVDPQAIGAGFTRGMGKVEYQ